MEFKVVVISDENINIQLLQYYNVKIQKDTFLSMSVDNHSILTLETQLKLLSVECGYN
jgi:hypothetical protein